MAITYPTTIDTLTNPSATEVLGTAGGNGVAAQLSDLNDVVEAIETKLGVDSSAVVTAIDYLLKNTSSSDPGHKHTVSSLTSIVDLSTAQTLTNKTLTSPAINLGSDAQGDVYYRSDTGFTRLAAGTSGKFLKTQGAGANPTWAAVPTISAQTSSGTPTTTSTSFVDLTSQTVSVVLAVTSHVIAIAHANASTTSGTVYIQVTYDTGGADTLVGTQGYITSTTDGFSVTAGGVVASLAAATYTFALQGKVSAGTGSFNQAILSILAIPA